MEQHKRYVEIKPYNLTHILSPPTNFQEFQFYPICNLTFYPLDFLPPLSINMSSPSLSDDDISISRNL